MGMLDWFRSRKGTPFMRATEWGPIAYGTNPIRFRPQPDEVGWIQPASVGQQYAGVQLRNGVAQLSTTYSVETAGDLPYWQAQTRQNPPTPTRFGGSPRMPMGPAQVNQLADSISRGKPLVATGIGTLYTPLGATNE